MQSMNYLLVLHPLLLLPLQHAPPCHRKPGPVVHELQVTLVQDCGYPHWQHCVLTWTKGLNGVALEAIQYYLPLY
jgi:hypothetical protein